jgi:hypothetical protein
LTVITLGFNNDRAWRIAALAYARQKERARELYRQHLPVSGDDGLAALAAVMAAEAGLDEPTALSWLTEFASAAQNE